MEPSDSVSAVMAGEGQPLEPMDTDSTVPAATPRSRFADRPGWEHRSRAARACDRCKKRKVRCTGTQPCEVCLRADTYCVYAAPYNRGRHPPAPIQTYGQSQSPAGPRRGQSYVSTNSGTAMATASSAQDDSSATFTAAASLDDIAPEPPGSPPRDTADAPAQNGASDAEPTSRASPELPQSDLQGHYVGPASGVSFLLRVQNRLNRTSLASGFTFGDVPLPEFDPTFCVMISKEETKMLIEHYFDFTVPVDRFLHRPTVEAWLQEFHDTMGAMRQSDEAPAKRACLWVMFAMSLDHLTPRPGIDALEKSMRYFLSAEYQLSRERGPVSLVSVQARLCQCLWLLSQSRMNHCWRLFGTAARLAIAIGLHRNRRGDITGAFAPLELECRRRTFWNAYCLDNYLSVALGRPRLFHDDDIDQELPSSLDDSLQPSGKGLPIMLAPVAYFKLSRILSSILRDLYPIRSPSTADRCRLAAKYSQDLKQWRVDMAGFLDDDRLNSALLMPIFRRQRNVLNLAYWHTTIITHRTFLVTNFAKLQHGSRGMRDNQLYSAQIQQNVKECIDAAMSIVGLVNDMIVSDMMFRAYWISTYFGFSAAVILYIYVIMGNDPASDTSKTYLAAATRCQNQLLDIAHQGSLAARYAVILEELRVEATWTIEKAEGSSGTAGANAMNGTSGLSPNMMGAYGVGGIVGADALNFNPSPESGSGDMATWLQFESLAVPDFSGFGWFEPNFAHG